MIYWVLFALSLAIALGTVVAVWALLNRKIRVFEEKTREMTTPFGLIQQQIGLLKTEMGSVLENNRQGMDKRLDTAAQVFRSLEGRMSRVEEVSRQVLEVGRDISGLQQILKAPKLRGNLGEELLGDLLAQMMPQENYVFQYGFKNGERVDAVIKTAQGLVPVDAKFPLENFSKMLAAEGDEEKASFRKIFIADVKRHVNDIAQKYIRPHEGTFDFALMYIPAENVYYEIITRDLGAGESSSVIYHALQKKVIPVSPNSFYAYLQTILLGLRGMQVEKRVGEIVRELARLRKEMGSFRTDFTLLGTHICRAQGAFDKSDKRLTRLESKLGALETEDAPEALPEPAIEN